MIFANFFKSNRGKKIQFLSTKLQSNIFKTNQINQPLKAQLKNIQAFILQKKYVAFLNLNYRSTYHFSVPKHKNTIDGSIPSQKKKIQQNKESPQQNYPINQVSWKLLSIPAFFLFPSLYVVSTVLISNSILMMMAQSDRFQLMIDKLEQQVSNTFSLQTKKKLASKKTQQQTKAQQTLSQNQIFMNKIEIGKKTYMSYFRNLMILSAISAAVMYGPYKPQALQLGLIGLNVWILFNIKFNNFSQGYYYTLLSTIMILGLFFYLKSQKSSQSPIKQQKSSQFPKEELKKQVEAQDIVKK